MRNYIVGVQRDFELFHRKEAESTLCEKRSNIEDRKTCYHGDGYHAPLDYHAITVT